MFGEILRNIRKKHNDSLRGLGEKSGIVFTYIAKVEKGENPPSKNFVEKMIKAYPMSKKKLLEAYVKEILPSDETIKIFKDEENTIEDIQNILISRLPKEERKIFLQNLIDKIELESLRQGKKLEDQEEIKKIREYIENL